MANHKSAAKRSRQAQVRRLRNRMNKSKMKTAIHKLDAAIAAGSPEEAQDALKTAISIVAKTASKGTIHKRNASRKISRMTKRFNAMSAAA